MTYHALDENTVCDYLQSQTDLTAVPAGGKWTAEEVGDGNLNLVFILTETGSQTKVVVKQALPYLRVAGESYPLSRDRMRIEAQALQLQTEHAPGLTPTVHRFDAEMSLVVMQYLAGFEVMRRPLSRGVVFPDFVPNIARFMARTHFMTSDLHLASEDKKRLVQSFTNAPLCELQEIFVYTNPFTVQPENRWNPQLTGEIEKVRQDAKLKEAIAETKLDYMTNAQALLHGDLHTGSIMAGEREIRVIDPEFAFFGPIGYDVGTLFANLVIAAFVHAVPQGDAEKRGQYQRYLFANIKQIWEEYSTTFTVLWSAETAGALPATFWKYAPEGFEDFQERYLQKVMQSVAGHAGCETLRRLMGIVSVWELQNIKDETQRAIAERLALQAGKAWLLQKDQIKSVDDFVAVAQDLLQ